MHTHYQFNAEKKAAPIAKAVHPDLFGQRPQKKLPVSPSDDETIRFLKSRPILALNSIATLDEKRFRLDLYDISRKNRFWARDVDHSAKEKEHVERPKKRDLYW